MYLYSDRSFRFCFTNRQMAEAICDFAREQMSGDPSLQLTSPRISLLSWRDDLFSEDLAKQFGENWNIPTTTVPHPLLWSFHIPHSVGSQNEPNRVESEAVQKLVKETLSEMLTLRGRELLVLPGNAALTRRVLRGLVRLDPNERFFWVVTTGDALSWNNIYRDRRLAWNIEDVPFPLIVFMHRNPVERNLHENDSFATESETVGSARCTGTDDLLLYRDIGQALARTCFRNGVVLDDPDQLISRLREEQDESGFSIFDALGNRQGKGANTSRCFDRFTMACTFCPSRTSRSITATLPHSTGRKLNRFALTTAQSNRAERCHERCSPPLVPHLALSSRPGAAHHSLCVNDRHLDLRARSQRPR
jgi:hypothetical protein